MSANISIAFDDGSEITFFDVSDDVVDIICDNYLNSHRSSFKV